MAAKRPTRPKTWIEIAIEHAGLRDALRAMNWTITWGVAREALGYEPSADEVAEWWKESRRTAFREQAAFRKAFPDFDTPAPICDNDTARSTYKRLAKMPTLSSLTGIREVEKATITVGVLPSA